MVVRNVGVGMGSKCREVGGSRFSCVLVISLFEVVEGLAIPPSLQVFETLIEVDGSWEMGDRAGNCETQNSRNRFQDFTQNK